MSAHFFPVQVKLTIFNLYNILFIYSLRYNIIVINATRFIQLLHMHAYATLYNIIFDGRVSRHRSANGLKQKFH